jgi:uncharacterized membrane protein
MNTGWNLIVGIGALVFLFLILSANTGKPLTDEHARDDRSYKIIITIVCVGIAIWSFLSL